MSEKMKLDEGSPEFKVIRADWQQRAKDMTLEELPEFLRHLSEDYEHDYGTICHALALGAVATCWAMDRGPQGGITGFQASAVMWSFIQGWMSKDGPMRLLDYSLMLFPQHARDFEKTLTKETWEWLQEQARDKLAEEEGAAYPASPAVVAHWRGIAKGKVPFGFWVK